MLLGDLLLALIAFYPLSWEQTAMRNHMYDRVLIVPSAVLAWLMVEWCFRRRIGVEVQTPEGQLQPAMLAFASDDRRRAALGVARTAG
jgi:hypothetical protein